MGKKKNMFYVDVPEKGEYIKFSSKKSRVGQINKRLKELGKKSLSKTEIDKLMGE